MMVPLPMPGGCMASNQQGKGAWEVGRLLWALSLLGPPAQSTSRQASCQQALVSSIGNSMAQTDWPFQAMGCPKPLL